LNEELNAAQGEIVDSIGRKMLEVLDRYSRENGYTVVLDTSAQGSPVVYGSSTSDITQDIVRLYDQAYPVKAGAASAPAAPKAAAPAPAPAPAKKPTP
jgi:outer membrane protein